MAENPLPLVKKRVLLCLLTEIWMFTKSWQLSLPSQSISLLPSDMLRWKSIIDWIPPNLRNLLARKYINSHTTCSFKLFLGIWINTLDKRLTRDRQNFILMKESAYTLAEAPQVFRFVTPTAFSPRQLLILTSFEFLAFWLDVQPTHTFRKTDCRSSPRPQYSSVRKI